MQHIKDTPRFKQIKREMEDKRSIMNDTELLKNMWGICIETLKNAANSIFDVGRINDTLIELRKRLEKAGVDMETLEK